MLAAFLIVLGVIEIQVHNLQTSIELLGKYQLHMFDQIDNILKTVWPILCCQASLYSSSVSCVPEKLF